MSLSASSATQDASIQAAALSAAAAAGTGGLARLRRIGGVSGQYTYDTKRGPGTLAFERGTITSVADGDVVVRAHDGTTWVCGPTGTSVVRDDGKRTTESTLTAGEPVFHRQPGDRRKAGRPADRDREGRMRHGVAVRRLPGPRARRRRRQSAGPRL